MTLFNSMCEALQVLNFRYVHQGSLQFFHNMLLGAATSFAKLFCKLIKQKKFQKEKSDGCEGN